MKPKIIAISGLAGDGKDSVCRILKNYFTKHSGYKFRRIALADQLKVECYDACLDLFGVDPITCSRKDKEKIRDFLVFYGKVMRSKSKGTHWTSEVSKKIERLNSGNDIFCIPDIRYAFYPDDECQWIKKNGGVHIHVQKFTIDTKFEFGKGVSVDHKFSTPVNKEELKNNPQVAAFADYIVEWHDCSPELPEHNRECIDAVNEIAKRILDSYIEKKSLEMAQVKEDQKVIVKKKPSKNRK